MRIVAAAVRLYPAIVTMLPPARHSHILEHLHAWGVRVTDPAAQGFVTDGGDYVSRLEARRIAERAGQLLPIAGNTAELFSEDVW